MDNTNLFFDVLKKLDENDILKDIILIGSWTLHIYKEYFNSEEIPIKRTLDIDFLIPNPPKIKSKINIPQLFKDINFDEEINLTDNYTKFVHPKLEIEFLINQKGSGDEKIIRVENLMINALPLRYLIILEENRITVDYRGIMLNIPEPTAFVLHKYLISLERKNLLKKQKDLDTANEMIEFLLKIEQQKNLIKKIYKSIHPKWQKKMMAVIKEQSNELYNFLID
ncbi:MAG: hypothetical protein A2Y41_00020 [Spirochaetes bacterium GWB1_36_13]|nr:MAG: hypothetical protein A2Y41_00020 [Spirochaetes bacterium GWB1_36_13]